ncbi:type II toxin-antitoxin system BrnA family antitoxin [Elusimicrobiota bacterium]
MRTKSGGKKRRRKIGAAAFDRKFDRGKDISAFLDLKKATVVKRVNVDFPSWMVDMLDREAVKLNVSRQAIIKMWIRERLDPSHRITL